MRSFLDRVGLWGGHSRVRAHGKRHICGAGELDDERSIGTSNAASESVTAVTKKAMTATAVEGNYDAVNGSDTAAVMPSLGTEKDEHLLAVARASEFSALKALELCQLEVLQLQRMWDLDRETQRWTIVLLQEEVCELRQQLEHKRRRSSMQRTRETVTATKALSVLSVNGGGLSLRCAFGMDAVEANTTSEAPMTSGTEGSCTRSEASAECASAFQYSHVVHDSTRVEELEERIERYGRLLHDANRECGELRAELSRVVRQLYDDRRYFTRHISSLLREKEEMAREHARTLSHLDETTGLLMAARAAERAALQRFFSEGGQSELPRVCEAPIEGAGSGAVHCLHCGGSSITCSELKRRSVDASVERQRCNSLALRQTTLEDELCVLECEVERDSRNVEGMCRIVGRLIDEVEGYARDCRVANQEAAGCLREMSLLWFTDEEDARGDNTDTDDDVDGHKSDDIISLLRLQEREKRDDAKSPECALPSAFHASSLLPVELTGWGDTSTTAAASAANAVNAVNAAACGAVVAPS
ncbi:hypothetical protein TraAM80_09093 [Trypanosoma rangeli]|uniref:Uncharacterized protein n=1 Tax=Trypanosoma rangeli TaxID=5698 RepID=A0A3R7N0C0_TRYRA|nr:uncharacterized protein TraAM80_09093 [Trypanosoma rangeli]RNE97924.1 hypothetical protein TraAM80_09093 [Trypanosoma rangeli]|eukprot:RNE97924.1 hypothetical protein TraAM80_09093 [Trypanosoma rangeli]